MNEQDEKEQKKYLKELKSSMSNGEVFWWTGINSKTWAKGGARQ